jgi:hypothetical protein
VDRKTRAVLDRVVGPEAPDLPTLNAHGAEYREAIALAWERGEINGWPHDDSEVEAAETWIESAWHDQENELRAEIQQSERATA